MTSGSVSDFIGRFLEDPNNANTTFNAFKQTLEEKFGEVYDAGVAFANLRKVKQLHGETVQIYGERLLSLAQEAYKEQLSPANIGLIEQQIVHIFIEGLLDRSIKLACLRAGTQNLEVTIKKSCF